jgi:HK97 family phage prohead protease
LKWIAEGKAGSGFTAVGRARANQLASGEQISADVVNRMISYFARHNVDRQANGFNTGEDGYPSAGRVAWDAWGGDAGQSWVNGLDQVDSVRALSGQIGISDFDDTLYVAGGLNQRVYDWITSQDVDLVVVTGRHERERADTINLLNKLGVEYESLIMQPDDQNDSAAYKGDTASKFFADGLDVVFVIENNAEARASYSDAGVDAVYSPDDLPEVDSARQLEIVMEDAPVTKDELIAQVLELKGEVLELVGKLARTVDDLSDLVESVDQPAVVEDVAPIDAVDVEVDATRFVEPTEVIELAKRGERVEKGIESRQYIQDLEIRAEGDGMTLRGYAAVFNSPSQPLPFIESIQPGAFRDSLKSRNDIKLLWNHDTSIVLGSTRAGTLRLIEDAKGLFVEADLPDTQAGRDAAYLIKRGDVNAFSFGFRIPVGGDEWPTPNQRILKRVNIHEASVVAYPAYQSTEGTASVRTVSDLADRIAELAEIRGISAEELTDALLALESGQELTERQGELLTETLGKVLQKDENVASAADILDLKKKQLDLLMKK